MEPPEELRARLERCGQGHLLQFWAELDTAQRAALLAALPPGLGEHCRLAAAGEGLHTEIVPCESDEALAQLAHRCSGCPIAESVQGQVGRFWSSLW
uniref:Uncharacterized protein n=1 Tax=Ficedula albicollis TaxID=59894 RepID=A0A803V0Y3_FICAL